MSEEPEGESLYRFAKEFLLLAIFALTAVGFLKFAIICPGMAQ